MGTSTLASNFATAVGLRPSPTVLLLRDLAGAARGMALYSVRGGTALVGGIVAWGFLRHMTGSAVEAGQIAGYLFKATEAIQLALCLLIPPLRGLGSVVQERRQATWDLLALTRLGPVRAALGKILAVVAHQLSLSLSLAPIQIVAGCYGGVGGADLLWLLVAVLDLSILGAAMGVTCGLASRKAGGGAGWLALVVLGLYGLGAGTAASWAARHGASENDVLRAFAAVHPAGTMFLTIPRQFPAVGFPQEGLLVGLPLQAAFFLVASVLVARRSHLRGKNGGGGRNVLRGTWRRPALGAALCFGFPMLVLLGGHAFGKQDVVSEMLNGERSYWLMWLGTTATLIHIVGPMLLATPLARERELGTMPLLLMLPRPASVTFLGPVKLLLLFDLLALASYYAVFAAAVWLCPDLDEYAAGMGIASAAAALWPAAVVHLASSLISSASKAMSGFVGVMLWLQLAPVLAGVMLKLVDQDRLADKIVHLCSFSALASSVGLATVLGFAAAGIATFALGARAFERLQHRFPVAR